MPEFVADPLHSTGTAAGTGDIADVAASEAEGTATSIPRGDHVHAHGSGYAGGHTDGGVSQAYTTVQDDGTPETQRSILNFQDGFIVVDDGVDSTDVDLDYGSPTASIDIGDAQSDGVATTVARSDHQHAHPAPGAGYPLDVALAESDGVATTPARSDHVHAHGSGYAGGHTDSASSTVASGAYGDGSDGDVNITGTVTLGDDKFYDTLTISSGDILQPDGFRIFCRTELNLESGGLIRRNGAAQDTTDMSTTSRSLLGGRGAGAGAAGTGGAGGIASVSLQILTDQGGDGGAGGVSAGGDGGDAAAPIGTASTFFHQLLFNILGHMTTEPSYTAGTSLRGLHGGAGGGGGGGNGVQSGAAGGQGGGVILIAAFTLTLAGTIEATGGDGGNSASQGGGGGGGGGNILLTYRTKTGAGSTDVTGGTAGTGGTNNGVNGQAGIVRELTH